MTIKNFSLLKIKKELSPSIKQLKGKAYSDFIKSIYCLIDQRLFDRGDGLHFEYFTTKQRKVISTLLSFIAHEGISHACSTVICNKAGVSYPTFKVVLDKLVDLQILLVNHCKKFGQQSANIYLMPYHPNFDLICSYMKTTFDFAISFDQNLIRTFDQNFNRSNRNIPYTEQSQSDFSDHNKLSDSKSIKLDTHVSSETCFTVDTNFEDALVKEKKEYCAAAGVPDSVTAVLASGLPALSIIDIWKSMQRTLRKHNKSFDHLEYEIQKTLRIAIIKYKKFSVAKSPGKFDFAGCICGFMIKYVFDKSSKSITKLDPSQTNTQSSVQDEHQTDQSNVPAYQMPKRKYTHKREIEIVKRSTNNHVSEEEFLEVMELAKTLSGDYQTVKVPV